MNKWLEQLKDNACPSIDECVDVLGEYFTWLQQFVDTPQDPEWHAEGNVHIHTGMVLDELYEILMNEGNHLRGERRQALILGALLHDIAKPVTTRLQEIKGVERVVASRHEARGRSYLAYKLMGLGLSYYVVSQTLGLVGEHHMPKLLVAKNQSMGDYYRLSRKADCELLYYLEVADMRGRICVDKNKQLEYLEMFRMFCEEYGVWKTENWYEIWRPFFKESLQDFNSDTRDLIFSNAIRDRESGAISTPEEAIAKSFQYRDSFAKLVLVCGPSGSGKTTWIKNHLPDYHIVSLDDIREELNGNRADQKNKGQVIQEAKSRLKHHLRSHHNVVWDATSLRCDFRDTVTGFGFDYQALVTLVVFHKEERAFFKCNKDRKYAIPESVLQEQIDYLEWPTPLEAHRWLVVGEKSEILDFRGGLNKEKFLF